MGFWTFQSFGELVPGMTKFKLLQAIAKAGLDEDLLRLFRYAEIRGNALFFVFKHPAAKLDFSYKKEQILAKMREYFRKNRENLVQNGVVFQSVQAIVREEEQTSPPENSRPQVEEKSTGDFEIRCTNPDLRRKFEQIRETIKAKNDTGTK